MSEPQTHLPLPPRERLRRHGAAALEDAELLAIMLRTGLPGTPVLALARRLLAHYGGLRGLLSADAEALEHTAGLGPAKACQLTATLELARRACTEPLRRHSVLDNPDAVARFCQLQLAPLRTEHCVALYLDAQLRLLDWLTLSQGTVNQAAVYPAEILRTALARHASALILVHNHPSGNPSPSQQDLHLTRQVKAALALVDIRLLDHLIVAGDQVCSLAARGEC